jgi:hypothetical protein
MPAGGIIVVALRTLAFMLIRRVLGLVGLRRAPDVSERHHRHGPRTPHDGRSTVEVDSADGRCRTRNDQKRPSRSSAGFGPLRSDPSASQWPIRLLPPLVARARSHNPHARWSGCADRPATPPAAPGTSAMGPTLSTRLCGARTPRRRAAQPRVSPKERNMICQHGGQPEAAHESRSGPS